MKYSKAFNYLALIVVTALIAISVIIGLGASRPFEYDAETAFKKYLEWFSIPVFESNNIGFDRVRYSAGEYVIQRDC